MQTSSILYLNWIWYLLASRSHRSDRSVGCIQWGHLGSPGSHKNTHHAIQSAMGNGCACSSLAWLLWVSLAIQLDFGQRSAYKEGPKQLVTTRYLPHGCHWTLLQLKLHWSPGTSQFCCCFMATLQQNLIPDYLQAFPWETVSDSAEQLQTKRLTGWQPGGNGVIPFQDKHSKCAQATGTYGLEGF